MNEAEDSGLLGGLTLVTNILLTTGYYHSHHLYLSCSVGQGCSSLSLHFLSTFLHIFHNFGTYVSSFIIFLHSSVAALRPACGGWSLDDKVYIGQVLLC